MSVAVLIEHRDGAPTRPALEALTLARTLGVPVAIWLGDTPSADAVAEIAAYGAAEVRVAAIGDAWRQASTAAAGVQAAMDADTRVLVVTSTFPNKEIVARLAITTGAGVVVDAAGADLVDGHVEAYQTVFSATWNVRTRIVTDLAIVGVRPNTTAAVKAEVPGAAVVSTVNVDAPQALETVTHIEPVAQAAGVPLAEAPVVVSGGRGTGGDYALIREFAELLGGAVGASRDATDEGWIGHEHMVGQTGTTVTPALYVACGISGAVHHRGGMQASGAIVAINIDPDAPIFEICDFGVVGDLFEVLPPAMEAIRAHRST